jgi:hypothetical protein
MPLSKEQREAIIAEILDRRGKPMEDLSDEELVAIIQRGKKLVPPNWDAEQKQKKAKEQIKE